PPCTLLRLYLDRDGDGWGDASSPVEACAPDCWLVERSGDCDDADASVHPDAREIAEDGIDQDCDGVDAVVLPLGACASAPAPVRWALLFGVLAFLRRREAQ